jgi:hypothetical protein
VSELPHDRRVGVRRIRQRECHIDQAEIAGSTIAHNEACHGQIFWRSEIEEAIETVCLGARELHGSEDLVC